MKAAMLYEYDPAVNVKLKIENVDLPKITAPDDVIVRVGAAGLCRTDLHIIEGVWRPTMDPTGSLLPYIMGHENAGWVEEVGSNVRSVKRGDAVICHPFRSCGVCLNCRHGEDMYCDNGAFPGLGMNGGFAEYFVTSERSLIKLKKGIVPIEVAPLADAGITAYRVAKRGAAAAPGRLLRARRHRRSRPHRAAIAARHFRLPHHRGRPGAGGPEAREGARRGLCARRRAGRHRADQGHHRRRRPGGDRFRRRARVENIGWKMVRKGGQMFVVGYGGKIEVPTVHLVIEEINIGGSLVGNYTELVELMELNADGKVKMHYTEYSLADINTAIDDFKNRRFTGGA